QAPAGGVRIERAEQPVGVLSSLDGRTAVRMHGHPYSKRARVLTGPVQPAEQPLPALFIQLRHLLRRAAAVPMLRAGAFGESRKARAGSVTEVDVLAGQFQ